ncbi:MAG: hypothetical protein WD871_08210 [Xanthobacteraceae bacterium]
MSGPSSNVLIVMLRQTDRSNPDEQRNDPFWEFGSFGCTGCHRKNILNAKRAHELKGMRLAFAQGGPEGTKIVYLSPLVSVVHHADRCELKWNPCEMPLKYSMAPVIIDNNGFSEILAIKREIAGTNRHSNVSKFASRFRTRCRPVGKDLAHQLEAAYKKARSRKNAVARRYEQAMPYPPPKIDRRREQTYWSLIAGLGLSPVSSRKR